METKHIQSFTKIFVFQPIFKKSKFRTWSFIEDIELHFQFFFPEIIQGIFISMLYLVRTSLCLMDRKLRETDEFQWLWEMNLIKIFQNVNQYDGQLNIITFYNLFYDFFLLEVSRLKIPDIQHVLFINKYIFVLTINSKLWVWNDEMFANKMDCITKLVLSLFMLINPKLAQIFVRHKLKIFFFLIWVVIQIFSAGSYRPAANVILIH